MRIGGRCARPQLGALLGLQEDVLARLDRLASIVAAVGRHVECLQITRGVRGRARAAAAALGRDRRDVLRERLTTQTRRTRDRDLDRVVLPDNDSSECLKITKNRLNLFK